MRKFAGLLFPIIIGFDIGPEGDVSTFKNIEDCGSCPFAAVLSASGEPDELWEISGCDDGGLFGFDDGDR